MTKTAGQLKEQRGAPAIILSQLRGGSWDGSGDSDASFSCS